MTDGSAAASWTHREFESPTGAHLALYSNAPAGAIKGVVHVNHGLAEHAARYAPFAAALNARGYGVYAQDHRGHGATRADDAPQSVFAKRNGWDAVMADVAAVNAHIRETHPGAPVIVFGHSMGGVIALNHVLRAPESVNAAAIWNATTQIGALAAVMKTVLAVEGLSGAEKPSKTLNALSFEAWNKRFKPNRTTFDWLSRDEAHVDAYVADPLCGWPASVALWRDLVGGIQAAGDDTALANTPRELPLHLLGGEADPATEGGKAVKALAKRLDKLGFADVELTLLDGRHEALNELDREQTITAFIDWLDARFANAV